MSSQPEDTIPNNVAGPPGPCLCELLQMETSSKWSFSEKGEQTFLNRTKRLENLLSESSNKFCADCGSRDPKWASLGFGVLVCIKCSGVHRSLGVHISKVLSVTLDEWTDEELDALIQMGGNAAVNLKYEPSILENCKKPNPDSSIEERAEFIRIKYGLQEISKPEQNSCPFPHVLITDHNHSHNSATDKRHNDKQTASHHTHGMWQAFRNDFESRVPKISNSMAGMVEFVGLIKVNVVRGTNLAVRDVMSSDPYVILSLGNQSVKTRVIKNNLNPVWNEQLMLSIPENIPPLKLLVYDKDTFTTDDFMGEAEIDIQPLVSAANATKTSPMDRSTHLEQGVDFKQVDANAKHDIAIKLQNVERGVLDIELECIPLTQ